MILLDTNVVIAFFNGNKEILKMILLLNYLKATGIKVGLLVNFKTPKAEIKRMVLNLPEGNDD